MRWMWIDRVVELETGRKIVTVKSVSLAEEHLHDHFAAEAGRPATPIMPGSLLVEGMAQTAGILVGHAGGFREKVALAKVSKAEFDRDVAPGQTIRYTATIQHMDKAGASTVGVVDVLDHGKPAEGFVPLGKVDLMFSHLDQNMSGIEFPSHNFVFSESFRTLLRTSGVAADF